MNIMSKEGLSDGEHFRIINQIIVFFLFLSNITSLMQLSLIPNFLAYTEILHHLALCLPLTLYLHRPRFGRMFWSWLLVHIANMPG